MTTLNNYKLPSTIPARESKYYGHWFGKEMQPEREAARNWARAQGYYDQASK
jgi:hypothetical protein